jgi:alpha-D-xyloside xylohydrolase
MGPLIQHTGEIVGKELTIAIYPGKNAKFTLYEDEGDNYNYEQGASSTIELAWDDKRKILTIGERQGAFTGMEKERTMRVVLHNAEKKSEKVNVIRYTGEKLSSVF